MCVCGWGGGGGEAKCKKANGPLLTWRIRHNWDCKDTCVCVHIYIDRYIDIFELCDSTECVLFCYHGNGFAGRVPEGGNPVEEH